MCNFLLKVGFSPVISSGLQLFLISWNKEQNNQIPGAGICWLLFSYLGFSPRPSFLGNIYHRGSHWQIAWPDVQRIIDFEVLWFCVATGQMFLLVFTVISGSKREHWGSWSQLFKDLLYHLIRRLCKSLLCLHSPKRWKFNFLDIHRAA